MFCPGSYFCKIKNPGTHPANQIKNINVEKALAYQAKYSPIHLDFSRVKNIKYL